MKLARGWTSFALLCLLAASRWLLADNWPEWGSTLRSEAWGCAIAATGCLGIALARRRAMPKPQTMALLVLIGMGLLAMPALGAALRGPAGNALQRTVALSLVPLVGAVAAGAMRDGLPPRLWPPLAGVAGTLLVFPLESPGTFAAGLGLILPPLAVGVSCVFLPRADTDMTPEWRTGLLLAGGALGLGAIEAGRMLSSGVKAQMFSPGAVALDCAVVSLTVLALLHLGARRYGARYVVIPLLTIIESAVLFHAQISLRLGAGMLLMALSAAALLSRNGNKPEPAALGLR